jgi:hypothetical protein
MAIFVPIRQSVVRQLHLFAGVVLSQVQVKPNQRESNCNRFRGFVRGFGRKCIDNVLMNKTRNPMS